ncbi:MAG: hypothetical protein IH591_13675 [Bacteroidales bacterium]|nr:hypothetical protein [Bacteroidales bacterium]
MRQCRIILLRSFLTVMVLLPPAISSGQLPESRVMANVSYEHFFLSGKDYRDYSFVTLPALFSNMRMTNGYTVEIHYRINTILGAGLRYRDMTMSGWQLEDQLYYRNVKSRVSSVSPVVMVTLLTGNRKSSGLLLEATLPGYSTLSLQNDLVIEPFEEDNYFDFNEQEEIITHIPGFGIEVVGWLRLGNSTGITASAGWTFYKTDSYHFPDASISGFAARIGLVRSVSKDKLYKYR